MKEWPQLTGRSFMEVLVSFPEAVPLGIRNANGLLINPEDNYIIQPGARRNICTGHCPKSPFTMPSEWTGLEVPETTLSH